MNPTHDVITGGQGTHIYAHMHVCMCPVVVKYTSGIVNICHTDRPTDRPTTKSRQSNTAFTQIETHQQPKLILLTNQKINNKEQGMKEETQANKRSNVT